MSDAIVLVSVAIHTLQLERGFSVVVAQSGGDLFTERLQQQKQLVDDELLRLQAAIDENRLPDVDRAEARRTVKSVRKHLDEHRSQNLQLASTDVVIENFTQQIIAPLIALSVSLSIFTGAAPGQVLAFQHFVQRKERMGLERSYGVKSFFSQPVPESFTETLRVLIRKQKEFEDAFFAIADSHQSQQVREKGSEVGSVIELTHALLQSPAGASALAPLTAEGWFELLSKRVDEMHQIELRLITHMRKPEDSSKPSTDLALPARLEKHREALLELPIFRNVPLSTVEHLLSKARVISRLAGHQVSTVGQRQEYLQIVISGWVKIFSTNEKGDEAILQMIGEGESVLESPVYRDDETSVQAEAEQDSELLQVAAS